MEYETNYEHSSLGKKIARTGLALLVAGSLVAGTIGCKSLGTYQTTPTDNTQTGGGGGGGGGDGGGGCG